MLTFAAKYAKNIFSQFGEDGIIEEVLRRLKITDGSICEFGAHDGKFCSNSRNLILLGWEALLIEGNAELAKNCWHLYNDPQYRDRVQVFCDFVTPENVNGMLYREDTQPFIILSIDVDGIDGAIWGAYEPYVPGPAIVIIEINSSLDPLSDVFADPERGSSYKSMLELGISKGYFLLCHTGNMIFVKNEHQHLFPESRGKYPLKDIDLFFNKSWLK